jgi:hypothetical protein
MSNQLQITGDLKVKSLTGALTATAGVVSSVPLGTANGVATLGTDGKVPSSQLPTLGSSYKGTWNAATNTPTIADGVGTSGDYYLVSTGGTFNGVVYVEGNTVIYSGTIWQRAGGGTGTVTSVGLSAPAAFSITGSPITGAGTLAIAGAGTANDYIKGDGTLGLFSTAAVASITGGASTIATSNLDTSKALNSNSTGKVVANITTATELAYLSGVTSNVQTQLDGKGPSYTLGSVSSSPTSVLVITGSGAPVNGSLTFTINKSSATENGYLSSTDWSTFNNKQNAISLTANSAVNTGSTGQLVASITTATELAYLSGVSSNVQTQLDGKASAFTLGSVSSSPTSVMTITGSGAPVNGSLTFTINQSSSTANGYLSSTDWTTFNNKGNRIVGSPNQAVSTGSTSQFVASITTATELSYLSGVSSNVQTQLDGKAGTFTLGTVSGSPSGVLSVTGSGGVVNGSLTVTLAQASASTSGYLSSTDWVTFNNAATGSYLPLSGGTLSGNLIVNGSTNTPLKITATEPYMEIQSNGSTNVCGIKFLPSTGYDAYVGNYGSGKLWLIAGNADNAYVAQNGDFFNRTGVYGTISDITLKENIVDATPKLDDLLKLKVRNFNFIGNDKKQLGFIAQEFEEVFPNAISIDNGYGDNNGKKVVKTTVLIPMLVKAIQELKAEIDKLKANNG